MTKKKIFYLVALVAITLPSFASAAVPNVWPTGFWGPLLSCSGNYTNGSLPPCTSLCDLISTIENIIYFGISVVVFIIAPVLFAWGGIMYMVSRGSPDGISKAKGVLTKTLLGVVITLGAWLIVNTFVGALGLSGSVGGFGTGTCSVSSGGGSPGYYDANGKL